MAAVCAAGQSGLVSVRGVTDAFISSAGSNAVVLVLYLGFHSADRFQTCTKWVSPKSSRAHDELDIV